MNKSTAGVLDFVAHLATGIIGYEIHHSRFWAFIDFLFWPLAWIKWVICQEVSLSIIHNAFSWFLK